MTAEEIHKKARISVAKKYGYTNYHKLWKDVYDGNIKINITCIDLENDLMQAYHTAKLEEVEGLPSVADLRKRYKTTNVMWIEGVRDMRSIAQSVIAKEREEKKYAEEMRNLCAQQCEHKNKLILEVCAERDALKAEIEIRDASHKEVDKLFREWQVLANTLQGENDKLKAEIANLKEANIEYIGEVERLKEFPEGNFIAKAEFTCTCGIEHKIEIPFTKK